MQEKKIRKKRIIKSSFLIQLYSILQNPTYDDIIKWDQKGEFFVILQKESLINQVLPNVYKHKKITSFLRQLNFYGFKRKCLENNLLNYYHPEFSKMEPNFAIQKKVNNKSIMNDIHIKQIQEELQEIKLQQIQMQSQIQQCAFGFGQVSQTINNLLNALFLQRLNIVYQGKGFLLTILKIFLGMQKEKKAFYQELLSILFPPSELEVHEPIKCKKMPQLENYPSNFSEFSPLPILQYMLSSCPATPVKQTSELLNIFKKMVQENNSE